MRRPTHPSLVIIADVGPDPFHVGDEAMLEANVQALRRLAPHARITVFGRGSAAPDEQRELTAVLGDADQLFVSGGGNLSSSWPRLLRQRTDALREARRLGIPVVAGGQTIGPELSAAERTALADALDGIGNLGVREMPSAVAALEMGVPSDRLTYQVDDAFLLEGRRPADGTIPAFLDEPFVAVTLDPSFAGTNARDDDLRRLASQTAMIASEARLHVAFVPHVGPLGAVGDEDGAVGSALCELLGAHGVACALLPVMPPAETVWLTQRAAAVISSRYHPLVFGTAAAVPSLGIHRDAYTRIKLQGALAHVGMGVWSQSADAAAAGGLLAAFRRLWRQREPIRAAVARTRAPIEGQERQRWQVLLERLSLAPARTLPTAAPPLPPVIAWHRSDTTTPNRNMMLTEQNWQDYDRDGFLHLGEVLDPAALTALRERADDLAIGKVSNPGVQMQLDTGGAYEDLPPAVARVALGTLRYRKIHGLETDDRFSSLVHHPLFLEIAARYYGSHAAISIFRAMVMNKPAQHGTLLPWHQDGGDLWALDRDPLITIWVALDTATVANGCVEAVPGSHHLGLLTTLGSTLSDDDAARYCAPERTVPLEVQAGHGLLMHNWLIHRSGVNPSTQPRRAFTACYMDGRTKSTLTGAHFPIVAGAVNADPYPFVRQLHDDGRAAREHAAAMEAYAASLRQDNRLLRTSVREATAYARSLENELARALHMRDEAARYAESLEAERQRASRHGMAEVVGRSA